MNAVPQALQQLLPEQLLPLCISLCGVKGEQLFVQNQQPEYMWYVSSGEVILQRLGIHGANLVLQRVRQGWVAEASLQSPAYHCDALVTMSGDVIGLPVHAIQHALLTDPAFAMRWVAMLNHELKRLRAQCERLSLKGVKDRLLHLLETEGEQGCLQLGTGLKSIAAELGVSHEALYRAVAELEKQGMLYRTDGRICYA